MIRGDDETSPLIPATEIGSRQDDYSSVNRNCVSESEQIIDGENSFNNSFNNSQITIVHEHKIKVYKKRWYVLLMFSLFATSQNLIWNTWGPISDSAKDAFGWTNADIGLLVNWGPISFLISVVFFSWMMDMKGLRISCIFSMFLVALGGGLRCITTTPPLSTWLIHVGQFFNGLGGPVAMAASPVISATWFSPNERTTATSIGVLIPTILGLAGSFLIGPLLVPPISNNTHNTSHINVTLEQSQILDDVYVTVNNSTNSSSRVSEERKHIMFLLYIEFAFACLVFIIMLIYFPKKPPLPPCTSASVDRQDFWIGLKALFRCKQFWLVAVAYGSSLGVCNTWTSVIDLILLPQGISQNETGWIGFYAISAGCVASLVVARFADIFSKHLKIFILGLYTVGTVFIIWFALACANFVPSSTAVFYVTVIMSVMTLNASTPLLYELACELAYPIGEGTTNGMMTMMNNLGGGIFLFILMKPMNTMWMNWTLVGSAVICFPLYGFLKETYNRLDLDKSTSGEPTTTTYIQ